MKTLRNLREDTDSFKLAPRIVEEIDDENALTDDVGHTLVALNHLAVIADDLYSAIGDGSIELNEDEINSVLSAYDMLSEIHDKYDDVFPMPSQEYDLDALDVEVNEEVQLQLEELELAEALAWQTMMKTLTDLGFKKTEPSKDTWQPVTPKRDVQHMFGIPMRAGKWADVFFVIFGDDDKPYSIIDAEGRMNFADLGKALAELKKHAKMESLEEAADKNISVDIDTSFDSAEAKTKWVAGVKAKGMSAKFFGSSTLVSGPKSKVVSLLVKHYGSRKEAEEAHPELKEGVSLDETPGGPSVLQKLKASRAGFQAKLDSGKFPKSAEDFKEMIARLDVQIKAHSLKKEDTRLDEAGNESIVFKNRDISKLTYNPNVKSLTATFKTIGDVYYFLVQPNEWKALMADKDPLNYFTKKIKGSHKSSPAAKPKSMQSENVDQIDEVKVAITKWNLAKGIDGQFRMEVIGQAGSDVARILDKVLPSAKFTLFDDQFGFKSTAERDAASAALVKYYKTIKEQDANEIPLGSISEEFDETKFRRLAMTGLVPDTDVALIIRAMKNLDAGKTLDMKQKNLIANTFQSLIGLVIGDVSVFTKIQGAIKKDVTNAK